MTRSRLVLVSYLTGLGCGAIFSDWFRKLAPSHDQMQTETNSDLVLAFSRASRSSCFNFEFLLASFDIFALL